MQLTPCWSPRRPCLAAIVAFTLSTVLATPASAQESKSSTAARELSRLLDAAKLDSIAAPDPANPGVWVAALYFKDSQLLLVSAQYSAPVLFETKAKSKEYRDIYIDLSSASIAGTKVFVQDQRSDGLVARPPNNDVADSVEMKGTTVAFDREWRKAKMSEADYMKTFGEADEHYARMLALLAAQVKSGPGL